MMSVTVCSSLGLSPKGGKSALGPFCPSTSWVGAGDPHRGARCQAPSPLFSPAGSAPGPSQQPEGVGGG